MKRNTQQEQRQKPLSEEEYAQRSKPRGAFAEVWEACKELPYSCHKYKVADVVAARQVKEEQ
jgi:hypothetical protein